jgi:hypothetical protein
LRPPTQFSPRLIGLKIQKRLHRNDFSTAQYVKIGVCYREEQLANNKPAFVPDGLVATDQSPGITPSAAPARPLRAQRYLID